MKNQEATSRTHRFSIASIPDLAKKLTYVQKNVFDEVWNYFVASGKPFPIRSLPRIIGKQSPQEAFDGLNGSLIYEKLEQGDRCYELTAYGAFLTGYGYVLATLLIRLSDLIKELYENDSFIKSIDSSQIKERLGTSDAETELLFKLLRLQMPPGMPFHLSGWSGDGSSWSISITDEVIGLFRSEDSIAYLDERLSEGYRPDEPCLYDDRLKRSGHFSFTQALPGMFAATANQNIGQSASPYISLSRIEELKKIRNARFDCTRLICMCEELNECATHGNAHAVIMLTRAILDHVPPVFEFKNFSEVVSNYRGGGRSFRASIERLEHQSRKVADRLLHMSIRDKEVAPNMNEVSFTSEIETLLSEFCRLLK